MNEPLLKVEHLTTGFPAPSGTLVAVNDVSLSIREGETLCLVGESGSGKSLTAFSILRLVPAPGRIVGGSVRFRGRDLLALSEDEMCAVRGADIALIFQEPMTALNPVFTVGDQIAESLVVHGRMNWQSARAEAVRLMASVRIPDAPSRARDYPHQLSGGQRQRVLIAMALACKPALVIADEPTTALDVTIQAEILDLLRQLQAEHGLALLLITHDLGVVAEMADHVAVMYAGRIVEEGPVDAIFASPQHPYTRGLLASLPGASSASSGGVQGPESAVRSPKSGVRSPESGVRSPESGVRSPESGVRSPESGVGRPARRLQAIEGTVPSLANLPPGCAFEPRCSERVDVCRQAVPALIAIGDDRAARCVHVAEVPR